MSPAGASGAAAGEERFGASDDGSRAHGGVDAMPNGAGGGAADMALRLQPYQQELVLAPWRMTWNNWSRQSGKSYAFTLRRLLRGMARRRTQLLLSAGGRQSRELIMKLREHCEALDTGLRIMRDESRDDFGRAREGTRADPTRPRSPPFTIRALEIRGPGGVRIIALPANPLTARGYTADIFLDEFAMHRDDRAIWAALLPTLLRQAGEVDIASTPRGTESMFHRLRDNPSVKPATVSLADAIGEGLEADGESMRQAFGDDRLFRSEFQCEFDGGRDAFMSPALIEACVSAQASKHPDYARLGDPRAELYAGVDVGRLHDLTVIWVWERVGEEFWTRGIWELAQMSMPRQHEAIAQVMDHRGIRRVCIDATGMGISIVDHAQSRYGDHRVEGVTFSPGVQSAMAARLRSMAEAGRLRIPADEAICADWHSLRRVVTPGGNVRLRAERGDNGHADRFWAAALGLEAAAECVTGPAECEFVGRLRFAEQAVL